MTELTRRNVLASTLAAGAAAAAPFAAPVRAAAPPAGKQAPGFYRYKVGEYEVSVSRMAPTPSRCPTASS